MRGNREELDKAGECSGHWAGLKRERVGASLQGGEVAYRRFGKAIREL